MIAKIVVCGLDKTPVVAQPGTQTQAQWGSPNQLNQSQSQN